MTETYTNNPIAWPKARPLGLCGFLLLIGLYLGLWLLNLQHAPELKQDQQDHQAGVRLHITGTGGSSEESLHHLGFTVAEAEAPGAGTDAGPFTATLTGRLHTEWNLDVDLILEGAGQVTLSIDNTMVMPWTDLSSRPQINKAISNQGTPFQLAYRSLPSGAGRLRVRWRSEDFPLQAIPPTALSHQAPDQSWQRGRHVFAALRCIRCHHADTDTQLAMPELRADAPSFVHLGIDQDAQSRTAQRHRDWIANWLLHPRTLRPDSSMPHFFHADPSAAWDIAAYLSNSQPSINKADAQLIQQGARLYHQHSCHACHSLEAPLSTRGETAESDQSVRRTPLHVVAHKFTEAALVRYLLQPNQHYHWNPMPDCQLEEDEAKALASFLLDRSQAHHLPTSAPAGWQANPERGKKLLSTSGCLNCHSSVLPNTTTAAPTISQLAGRQAGCIADTPSTGTPHYPLDRTQRQDLYNFLHDSKKAIQSLTRHSRRLSAARYQEQLRCLHCHAPDSGLQAASDREGLEHGLRAQPQVHRAGDQVFAARQQAPRIDQLGDKLRGSWLAALLTDRLDSKPRPYLHTHMPVFQAQSQELAQSLLAMHGQRFEDDQPAPITDTDSKTIGEELMSAKRFNCVTCHDIGELKATEVFEHPGLDLALARQRLRQDYFHRWMANPTAIDENTGMPAYADHQGLTSAMDIYDGKADKQFAAIWQALWAIGKEAPRPLASLTAPAKHQPAPHSRPTAPSLRWLVASHALLLVLAVGTYCLGPVLHAAGYAPGIRRSMGMTAGASFITLALLAIMLLASGSRLTSLDQAVYGSMGLACSLALAMACWCRAGKGLLRIGILLLGLHLVGGYVLLWQHELVIRPQHSYYNYNNHSQTHDKGATLFAQSCATCHGADGHGHSQGAASLRNNFFISQQSDSDLLQFLQRGRLPGDADNTSGQIMPARGGNPNLDDKSLQQIIGHLRHWQTEPSKQPLQTMGHIIGTGTSQTIPVSQLFWMHLCLFMHGTCLAMLTLASLSSGKPQNQLQRRFILVPALATAMVMLVLYLIP